MINIIYSPALIKQLNKIEVSLQEEVIEKIKLFTDKNNHQYLKVHKLHGKFSNCFSFSVNYKVRIVFQYEDKNKVALLAVGDHDIYK